MENHLKPPRQLIGRLGLAFLFASVGSLIIIVFSQYRPMFHGVFDLLGRIGLILALLITSLLLRKSEKLSQYWPLIFGLFIMTCAVSLDWWTARFVIDVWGGFPVTPAGVALEKLKTVFVVALSVIALTRFSGKNLGSICIQRGDLRKGLTIGLLAFAFSAAGAIPMSRLMFAGEAVSLAEVLKWAPWILICVLANAANEELLFRGLFLRKLEPFYGKLLSNCLIVVVFTGLHLGVGYTKDQVLFLVVVMLLAFAWGALMQKTDSIWGSILFHAGTDIPVFMAIFSTRF